MAKAAQTPHNNNDELIEFLEDLDAQICKFSSILAMILILDAVLTRLEKWNKKIKNDWFPKPYFKQIIAVFRCLICVLTIIQEAKIKNKLV